MAAAIGEEALRPASASPTVNAQGEDTAATAAHDMPVRGGLHINSQEKAEEIMIFSSCQRPYMRGFHGAWLSFFFAFLGWFAFAPLMTTIRDYIDISKGDIGTAGIVSVGSTIFTRFAVGPAIDRWGPRRCMAGTPTATQPTFLGRFTPVCNTFPLGCPASWRRAGEKKDGRK